jgi:hypothetical protein
MSAYSVQCDCGRAVAVLAVQAGAEVRCPCGRGLAVPPLSRLRRWAGQAAYEGSIVDSIKQMVAQGEVSSGGRYARCQMPTTSSENLHVVCESVRVSQLADGGTTASVLMMILMPIIMLPFHLTHLLWHSATVESPTKETGRELVVRVPLAVCPDCRKPVRRLTNQPQLHALLRTEPIYCELLDEYPDAKVIIDR